MQKIYNAFTKLVRRIMQVIREYYLAIFIFCLTALFSTIGLVLYPILVITKSPDWSVTLSRLKVAWPVIIVLLGLLITIWRDVKKIDKTQEQKQDAKLNAIIKKLGITDEETINTKKINNGCKYT
jgi:hypothetical protein